MTATFASENGWTYHPAMVEGTSGATLVGLLATHDPATVPLGSVSVVWYPKGVGGMYSMQLFTGTPQAAVASLCDAYSTPTLFAHSSLTAGNATPWDNGELLTTSGGIADSDPASLIAELLTPEQIQLLIENGSTGATAISGEEVEIGSEGNPAIQQRLSDTGTRLVAVIAAAVVDVVPSLGQAGLFGDDCTPGYFAVQTSQTTCANPGAPFGRTCTYTCTTTTTTWRAWRNADCSVSGMSKVGGGPVTSPPFTITRPLPAGRSTCPPKP